VIGAWIKTSPLIMLASAAGVPLAFAWLSGSGMAATQSLFSIFTGPSHDLGLNAIRVGSVVSIGAAAGRTMSPVSAVALMCGSLTQTSQIDLCKRVCLPLLAGLLAVVTLSLFLIRVR
jgi:C4-dicarboxylate transporter, DcuC family